MSKMFSKLLFKKVIPETAFKIYKHYVFYKVERVFTCLVSVFLRKCWQIRSLNDCIILQYDHEWSSFGDHKRWSWPTQKQKMVQLQCYPQVHRCPILFINFIPVKKWMDKNMVLRYSVSKFTNERIWQYFIKKIREGTVFNKARIQQQMK